MEKRRILTLFLCMGLLAALLTGCGNNMTGNSGTTEETTTTNMTATKTTTAEAYEKQVEIRYAIWDKNQEEYLQKAADEFMKLNPDIKITIEVTSWDEYWTKLEVAATGGSIADVFWMNGPNITKYARGGILLPLDNLVADSDLDMSNYPSSLVDLYTIDGSKYALPKDFDTIAVWYNKAIFDAAGVDYPTNDWTWEDMAEIVGKLTNADAGVYGIASQYINQEGIYNTIFANGGNVISEDKTTSGYDSAATKKGIQCWVELQKNGYSPSEASLEETPGYVQFESGKIAMIWGGSWKIKEFSQADGIADVVDCVEVPTINGQKASVIHGLGNCIYANTEHPAEAGKWVEFLAGEIANTIQAESGAAIPAYTPATSIWSKAYSQYNTQAFLTAAKNYSYAYPVSASTAEWQQSEADYLKLVFSLDMTVDEACNKLAADMNKVLGAE
ncbi:MAG: sugar ABC transporter substrate-binding protein [Anaerocolumna sp.]